MVVALVIRRGGRQVLGIDEFESRGRVVLTKGDGEYLIGAKETERPLFVVTFSLFKNRFRRFS
jgi:hypothetical protein